jgi:hypothetical protein
MTLICPLLDYARGYALDVKTNYRETFIGSKTAAVEITSASAQRQRSTTGS